MQARSVKTLIQMALDEDIGSGDITTDNLIDSKLTGKCVIMAKEPLVLAGIDIARQVFQHLDTGMEFEALLPDGNTADTGDTLAHLQGNLAALLKGERTALNFLQRLSGIATNVAAHVRLLEGYPVQLVDTRKTAPGWRVLEKYAVRVGGAHNHRMGLYDGVLIKDNHIAAFGGVARSISHVRKHVSHLVKIEVEVSTLADVEEALQAGVDVIMLDNMSLEDIKAAVAVIQHAALVEVSGNITRANLRAMADTGVDIISVGALTHGSRAVDISMRIT
ncbi:MAG: carboxylating nicotinate-nucleotide diphosphorylase [Deltaproteobacteria bacterium]|jgi:nicotinate-nucleotide pyrophosphorylase (carboxylating)|nr:carboxylating nicotinate-nucleotide diphosphorylase [Deltaproteobacteria bacterium]